MKKLIVLLSVLFLIAACLAGCEQSTAGGNTPVEPSEDPSTVEQEFSRHEISFTFPGDFIDYTNTPVGQGYSFLYANSQLGLIGLEEPKEKYPDFAGFLAAKADELGAEATQKNGFWTLTYIDETQNEPQTMLCIFYESESSFWTVKAYCPEDVYTTYAETMWEYATSAKLD